MQSDSIKSTARNLRILYPIWMVVGMLGLMFIPNALMNDDVTVTISNIEEKEVLFRLGILVRIITQLLYIIIPLFLYKLFKDVNHFLALLMVSFAFISVPITIMSETFQFMILEVLSDPQAVTTQLSYYGNTMSISMIFWGLWLFPLGVLVYRSGFFPKAIGVLVIIAGLGYTFGSIVDFINPHLLSLKSWLEILTFGEVIFILWLVILGIKRGSAPNIAIASS